MLCPLDVSRDGSHSHSSKGTLKLSLAILYTLTLKNKMQKQIYSDLIKSWGRRQKGQRELPLRRGKDLCTVGQGGWAGCLGLRQAAWRWHHTTGFCLSFGTRDQHGQDRGREACGSWEWLVSVHVLLWLNSASLGVFES